jgi:uncharacterized protein (DUF1800 family)
MTARLGRRGFVGGTAALSVASWAPRPADAGSAMGFDDARHLLSRTSFGATPAEIRALEPQDFTDAVGHLLAAPRRQAVTPGPDWVNESPTDTHEQRQAAEAGDKPIGAAVDLNGKRGLELGNWWVEEMLVTDQPLVEKMTLFWHNHFTSSVSKVHYVPSLYWQNALFRQEALGNFATLLRAVARDPAMLIYLDGERNIARQPNENFARELLELFTLGEGHYSEADVKNAARAFTGWSVDQATGRFVNRPRDHDDGEKTFLDQTGRFDGNDIVAILLRHPRTAETIVEKLWREFVSMKPDQAEVTRLAGIFRNGNYEMKPLLRAMFLSPAFRDPANRAALIKSPIELIVGTVHMLGLPVPDETPLVRMMSGLGQSPFDPPDVKGWPGGESWITTNTLLLRQQFLRRIIEATTVWSLDGNMMTAKPDTRANRRQQSAQSTEMQQMRHDQVMAQLPVEGRSLRDAGAEAKLGRTLIGIDESTLVRTLLAHEPIDAVDTNGRSPGAVVAAAMLDPAYQLK